MEIKNRNVLNPNKRILNILKTKKNEYGEIISLEVEMTKDEGEVYEEGFALNAENLNALIQGYKIDSIEDVWTETKKNTEINITSFRPCNIIVSTEENELCEYSVNKIDDKNYTLTITAVNVFEEIVGTFNNIQMNLAISIYDQISEQKIGFVNYVITYINKSETSID